MNYKKTILANGLRIITVPMKDNPTVTVLVMVEAGSKYEAKEINGLSHFLEHLCFKGTSNRPKAIDITRELDSIGAEYNAFTGEEYTGYYAKSDYKHALRLLDVISDMYLNPIFEHKEIEKEKGVIIEEINMYEDMPQRDVQTVFMNLLYGDQPAGWDILGPKKVIQDAKRDAIVDYRAKHYVASATTVIVSGRIDEEKIVQDIANKFKGVSTDKKHGKAKTIDTQKEPAVRLKFKETDQTHLVLGVRTFDTYSPNNPILKVLTGVLSGGMSSRLFQKLRDEMGVCYYVSASNDAYTDHGLFQVAAGVDSKRVEEVIKVILSELSDLKNRLVSEAELRKVKDYLIGSLYLGLESSDELAMFYGGQEILKKSLELPDAKVRAIEQVSSEDIQMMAQKIFRNEHLNLAILGRFTDSKPFLPLLTFN